MADNTNYSTMYFCECTTIATKVIVTVAIQDIFLQYQLTLVKL